MYRLAKDLGLTVAQLQNEMTVTEFKGWAAFYKKEAAELKRQNTRRR